MLDSIAIIAADCKSVTFLSGRSHITEIIIINRQNPFEIEPLKLDTLAWSGFNQWYLYNNINTWYIYSSFSGLS